MTTLRDRIQGVIEGDYETLTPEEVLEFVENSPDSDEDHEGACLAHAAALGLYFYCSDYHGGQNSKEYEVLCKLTRPGLFSIGCVSRLNPEEDYDAITVYEALGGEFDH